MVVWAGEIKRMPSWVADLAARDTLDKDKLTEELAKRQAYDQELEGVYKKSFELRKQKNMRITSNCWKKMQSVFPTIPPSLPQ